MYDGCGSVSVIMWTDATHISVEREISLGPVLSRDHTVPPVDACNDSPLELVRSDDLHRHHRLQDHHVGFLER